MPGFSAPGGVCLTQICKAEFLIHLHFFIQTGEEKFLSSFLCFLLAVSGYQFTSQSLHTIFRTDIQTQKHDIFAFRITQRNICEEFISESLLICRNSIKKCSQLSGFLILSYQKCFCCCFYSLCQTFRGTCLIWRETDLLDLI